jgi:hypothetical protein
MRAIALDLRLARREAPGRAPFTVVCKFFRCREVFAGARPHRRLMSAQESRFSRGIYLAAVVAALRRREH